MPLLLLAALLAQAPVGPSNTSNKAPKTRVAKKPALPAAPTPAPTPPPSEPAAPTGPTEAELLSAHFTRAFDAQQEAVGTCVLDAAPADTTSWVQVVKATAVVNADGQLFSLDVVLEPAPTAKADETRACIEKALRGVTSWPKATLGPLASSEHSWTFKLQ